jgi:hypothetical protein
VEPLSRVGMGIGVSTIAKPPTPTEPGKPENVSGFLFIVNNSIDVAGGTASDETLGVLIFSVGQSPDREVDVYVSGNRISNVTERAVNVRQAGGRIHIEGNVIKTGAIAGSAGGAAPDAIHAFGTGSYVIANNLVQSDWARGAGIRVHGGFAEWPVTGAVVAENDVTMSAPEGVEFGTNSAGIEIRGYAEGIVVVNNKIRGHARSALAVVAKEKGLPVDSKFLGNDVAGLKASVAGVPDAGTGTVIVRLGGKEK